MTTDRMAPDRMRLPSWPLASIGSLVFVLGCLVVCGPLLAALLGIGSQLTLGPSFGAAPDAIAVSAAWAFGGTASTVPLGLALVLTGTAVLAAAAAWVGRDRPPEEPA